MHYIYVIAPVGGDGPCKVGISKHPERRCKQLQTGHALPLRVHHSEPIEAGAGHAKLLERLFHRDLRYRRMAGEWFNLTVAETIALVRATLIDYDAVPDLAEKLRRRRI